MPILDITAPTFATTLNAPFTLAQCDAFMRQAFANCNFPAPAASRTGSVGGLSNVAVYDFNFNPAATYGRFKFIFETSQATAGGNITLRATFTFHSNYNNTTFVLTGGTGANSVTGASFVLTPTNAITAYSVPTGHEIFGVVISRPAAYVGFLGMAYFSNKESWYDENSWCWAMLAQPNANSFWSPFPNPFASSTTTPVDSRCGLLDFSARNVANNKVYAVKSPFLTYYTYGIGGQLPPELAITNSAGLLTGDILVTTEGVEEYWLVNPAANGLAYRCV